MIKVTVGNNVERKTEFVDPDTTLRSVVENAGLDYSRSPLHLDGSPLRPGDLDKTFSALGVTEKCYLLSVTKGDGAVE